MPDTRDDNQHPEQAPNRERIAKMRARLADRKENVPTPKVVWPRDLQSLQLMFQDDFKTIKGNHRPVTHHIP